MKFSVMIPTLVSNDKQMAMTVKCIELAREKTKIPFELVIVETGTELLFEDFSDVYINELEKTTATQSFNNGFMNCSGDYITLLTNDVYVDDGWLEALYECFEKKSDCGIATLATDQFHHEKHDEISEGVWFSVAMFPKQDKYFDEAYVNSWDDTDFVMRNYLNGKKMYRNYNCVVKHLIGQTHYASPKHYENFRKNADLFKSRYRDCGHYMYDILTGGRVI